MEDSPAGPRRLTGLALLRAATVVVVLVAVIGWLLLRATPGPLGVPSGGGTSIGIPARVGQPYTVGFFAPKNRGSATLVIDRVVPDDVPSGLRLLGYRAIAWGEGGVASAAGFPPRGYHLGPVGGWRMEPGQSLAVAVGIETLRSGTFTIPGFTLQYHRGWHRYSAHYQQAIRVNVSVR